MTRDRKRFTYESLEKTCLTNLSQEEKDKLVQNKHDEFFADCDEDSVDFTNTHSMHLLGDAGERFL